jgi:hypothetical protein
MILSPPACEKHIAAKPGRTTVESGFTLTVILNVILSERGSDFPMLWKTTSIAAHTTDENRGSIARNAAMESWAFTNWTRRVDPS